MKLLAGTVRRWLRHLGWEWALFLIVLGSRLSVLAYAGSPLPYYDQWLAEFNNTLLRAAGGGGLVSTLFLPHNEHLIVLPKLLSLFGYLLNGYWDVDFLAVAAALLRAGVAAFAYRLLSAGSRAPRPWIFTVCLLVFAVPYSGYNQLCGLQISFYFADLALLWSIHTVLRWSSLASSGAQLVLSVAIGLLSLAAAVAVPVASLAVHLATGGRRRGFWIAWSVSLGLAIGFAWNAAAGNSTPVTVERVYDVAVFFFALLSWPIMIPLCGVVAAGFVGWRFVRAWRSPEPPSAGTAAALGIGTFAGINALFIALNRSPETLHMRHWETLALLPLCLFALFANGGERDRGSFRWPRFAPVTAAVIYLGCFGSLFWLQSLPYLQAAHRDRDRVVTHYRQLLLSSEIVAHATRINEQLARRDYTFFDDPIGRFGLHPIVAENIRHAPLPSMSLLAPELVPARPASPVSEIVRAVKHAGGLILGAGVLLAGLLTVVSWRRQVAPGSAVSRSTG